jgi:hypothetical protein
MKHLYALITIICYCYSVYSIGCFFTVYLNWNVYIGWFLAPSVAFILVILCCDGLQKIIDFMKGKNK